MDLEHRAGTGTQVVGGAGRVRAGNGFGTVDRPGTLKKPGAGQSHFGGGLSSGGGFGTGGFR